MSDTLPTPSAFFVAPSGKLFARLNGTLFYSPDGKMLYKTNVHTTGCDADNGKFVFSALNLGIQHTQVTHNNALIQYAGELYTLRPNYRLEMPVVHLDPDYRPFALYRTAGNKFLLLCLNLAEYDQYVYFDGKPVTVAWGKPEETTGLSFTFDGHTVLLTNTGSGTLDSTAMELLNHTHYAIRHNADGTVDIA